MTPHPDTVSGAAALDLSDERWDALQTRDLAFDSRFVYAVRTTGIFCRPSCAARTPRRENVALFPDADAARAAGFRPCKRCRPDRTAESAAENAVARARALLDRHAAESPDGPLPLADLAARVGLSRAHLQRQFTRLVGLSPKRYLDGKRLDAFRAHAADSSSVLEAAFEAGLGSQRAVYAHTVRGLGMTPGAYRRGGAGVRVRYAIFDAALGTVLVAATERGVCTVSLGDDAAALESALRAELPQADVARDDAAVGPWAEPVLRFLQGGAHPDVSLDLDGSDFQLRVWAALQAIPVGETRTYGEVAAALGQPTAARAVARACATNRVALVVPCHRVVGADGALRGYRWTTERKRALLDMEHRIGAASPASGR